MESEVGGVLNRKKQTMRNDKQVKPVNKEEQQEKMQTERMDCL